MKKAISILLALALCLGLGAYVLEGTAAADGPAVFTDVADGAYYAGPVRWAVEKGITNGTGSDTFSPDIECTTAQIITFLWRAMGEPASNISNPFSDVKEGEYYYTAALWACEKGMVSGRTFGPDVPCTRSRTVTYLWICAGKPTAKQASFSDVSAGADYAAAVSWAVEKGITTGTSATTFSPDNTCTRGQIVTFLHRDIGGAAAAVPDNSGTQRMAQAMLDKLAGLGEPEAYLVDMNADGTPELVCYDADIGDSAYGGGYHVFRWDGRELYEHQFNYSEWYVGYTFCGYNIAKYRNEYALAYRDIIEGNTLFVFYFLDRTAELLDGVSYFYDFEEDEDIYTSYYLYNGTDISEEAFNQLCDEYDVDSLPYWSHVRRTDLPEAKTELMRLLAG